MKIRKEQLAALGAKKAARQRGDLLQSFRDQGIQATEETPGGEIVLRDAAGGSARLSGANDTVTVVTGEQRRMQFTHDAHQQLRRVTDPAGLRVEYDYDRKGRLAELRRGSHSKFGFGYDELNHLNELRHPDGTVTRYTHDGTGNVLKVVDRNQSISRRAYDTLGRQTQITDWQNNATELRYGDFDLPEEIVYPHGVAHQYRYRDDGELAQMLVGGRPHAAFATDDEGNYRIDYADGTFVRLKHKGKLLLEAENESGTVKFEYDGNGRIVKEDTDGRVVEYQRDELGNLMAIVAPGGKRIQFERDQEHRVKRLIDWNEKPYDVAYHKSGALAGIRFPNGSAVNMEATEIGLPSSLTITAPRHSLKPVVDCKYAYDVCDRLTRQADGQGEIRYSYDNEGRLREAADSSGERSEQFTLDNNGNRTSDAAGRCLFNGANQLTGRGGDALAYDDLGNTTAASWDGKQIQFRYNGRGQVVEALTPNGKVEYTYDAIGRRILKRYAGRNTRYIWAGSQLLCEITGDTSSERRRDYMFFAGHALPVAMLDGEKTYYFHCGRRCEPLAMTDGDGALVWQAEYSAFGKANVAVHEHRHQPFRLAGQYYDEETGLHYNVARYYSPELGRFLTPDPLREAGGSLNLYVYCGGDPLNQVDPNGEAIFAAILIGVAVGAVIGAAIGGGVEAYKQSQAGEGYDGLAIAKAAGIGGLIGAVGGGVGAAAGAGVAAVAGVSAGAMALAGFVEGVVGSIAEQCAESKIKETELDPLKVAKEAAIDGLVGAAIGLVTFGVGGALARRMRKGASDIVEEAAEKGTKEATGEVVEETAEKAVNPKTRLPRTKGEWIDGSPGNGQWKSDIPEVNAVTGGKPIQFVDGRPVFTPWSKGQIKFKPGELDGSDADFNAVYDFVAKQKGLKSRNAAKNYLREQGLTPHHLDNTTIQLIPTDLHGNIPHIGSASDMRGGF